MPPKYRIILVDDNEDELFFMKEGLTSTGLFEVVGEAENGEDFWKRMQRMVSPPHLIISDLNMPGKDGYELIKEMKSSENYSGIPIIIISNAPEVPFAEKCKEIGACAYFTKPPTYNDYHQFAHQLYARAAHCLESKVV